MNDCQYLGDKIYCYVCNEVTCQCLELRYGNGIPDLIGLYNTGNTCYMNSVLQCLNTLHVFSDYITYFNVDVYENSFATNQTAYNLYCILRSCFERMAAIQKNAKPLRMYHFKDTIESISNDDQQDAQEFFLQLIQQLKLGFSHVTEEYALDVESPACSRMSFLQLKYYVEKLLKKLNTGWNFKSDNDTIPHPILEIEPLLRNKNVGNDEDENDVEFTIEGLQALIQSNFCTVRLGSNNFVSEVFDGRIVTSIQCSACKKIFETVESFQELSLPIPSNNSMVPIIRGSDSIATLIFHLREYGEQHGFFALIGKLTDVFWRRKRELKIFDCLKMHFKVNHLGGSDSYRCSYCKRLRSAKMQCRLLELPEVLCLHLKRVGNDNILVNSYVQFPLDGLDLKPYLHNDCISSVTTYKLVSVVKHSEHGSSYGGHFVSFGRNYVNNEWYLYDDSHVVQVTKTIVANCNAYMLFYKKDNPDVKLIRKELAAFMKSYDGSEDSYVLSNKWLYKYNTFDEPGFIDNTDVLCLHGCVKYAVAGKFWSLFKPVPKTVWKMLSKRFKGGPVCRLDALKHCRVCDANALKQTSFAVTDAWMDKWNQFTKYDVESPGPVDNMELLADPFSEEINYSLVNFDLWENISRVFGGGPEISEALLSSIKSVIVKQPIVDDNCKDNSILIQNVEKEPGLEIVGEGDFENIGMIDDEPLDAQ